MINTLERADYAEVKELYINPNVRKYLGGTRQEGSIITMLDEMVHAEEDPFHWVVREKSTGDFIGVVSLDFHHEGTYHEVSYQLLPNWWGAGYATEAVQAIIDFALNDLNFSRVIAETQSANKQSCRLLERLGMEFEKTISRFGAEQAIYSINRKTGG